MKILILGFSRSGQSAYDLLKENNEVYIYDKKKLRLKNYLSYSKLKKELPYFNLIIRSPGIKITSKVYQLSLQLTNKMISEIELGLNYLNCNKIIAVTGSNGKTTLVKMIHFLLKDHYKTHQLGNVGIPLTSKIKEIGKDDIAIIELSSFQLENTTFNQFDIGVITNLQDNHFDSVFSKESYFASKLKLVNMSKEIYLDSTSLKYAKNIKNVIKSEELEQFLNPKLNKYNQLYWNIACDIALKFGISKEEIKSKQFYFEMEHYRMEEVYKTKNFNFINDSKSTSISATNACLDVYQDKPRIIILGGISKREDFSKINKKSKDIIISYGKSKLSIFKKTGDFYFLTLEEALLYVKKRYRKEYYIIFSPACASLDQYSSYIERGEKFNFLINNLF